MQSLAPFSFETPEPEIVAPPLEVPVPLPEPARMSAATAPVVPKLPEVDSDPRLSSEGWTERAPSTAPRSIAADPNVTIDDVLAENRARWARSGASPEDIKTWDARERKRLEAYVGGPKSTTAHIAQATGPVGTIGTIGEDMPGDGASLANPGQAPAGGWDVPTHDDVLKTPSLLDVARLQIPGLMTPPILDAHSVVGQIGTPWEPKEPRKQEDAAKPQTAPDFAYERTADVQERAMSPEELGEEWANLSPEEQEKRRRQIEDARSNFASARMLEESEKAHRAAQANAEAYAQSLKDAQQRAAEIDLEARNLADTQPLDSITGTQKVLGVLAAIVGGFNAVNTGGKNTGLEAINRLADDAAQRYAQKLQLNARQRSAAGDMIGQAADVHRAQEVVRLATYDASIKKLEADVQNFDPRGSTALRTMDTINALKVQRQEIAAKKAAEDAKRIEAERKAKLEDDKAKLADAEFKEKQRQNREENKLAGWRISQDAKQAKDRLAFDEKQLALEADKLRAQGDEKSAKQVLEQGVAAPPEAIVDEQGSVSLKTDTGPMRQVDDKAWIIPTVDEAKDFRKKKAATDILIPNLDEIRMIRDRVGGESSVWNSDDYQRLQVIKNNLVLVKKSGTQGMSSDADMNKLIAALGAKDPASFRAQMAGLDEGRRQLENQLDTEARALGYNGKRITYTDPLKRKGPAAAGQSAVEKVLAFDPTRVDANELAADLGLPPEQLSQGRDALAKALQSHGGVPPSIKRLIDEQRDAAARGKTPKEREQANEALAKIAAESESKAVRDYAQRNAFAMPPEVEEVR
jgi:hypothetical protein